MTLKFYISNTDTLQRTCLPLEKPIKTLRISLALLMLASVACKNQRPENEAQFSNVDRSPGPSGPPVPPPEGVCSLPAVNALMQTDPLSKDSVKITASFNITSTQTGIRLDTDFSDIQAPGGSQAEVRRKLAPYDAVKDGTAAVGDWGAIYAVTSPPNPQVRCSVIPLTQLDESSGTGRMTVTFQPPLPYFVTLQSDPIIYNELSAGMTVNGITATVMQADSIKQVAQGTSKQGSVSIQPVPLNYGATHAFQVVIDFGGFKDTLALGMAHKTTYYIANGTYVAVVLDTGDNPAQIVFKKK